MLRLITLIPVLILIPILSWGLGENIKNNKDAIKEKIQEKVEVARSNNNNPNVSSANKELIHQFKNDFTTIEDLEETLASAVKVQGKDVLFQDIQTTLVEKVIVAENLYKNLNEDDLKEITNLLISLRVLDKTSYHSLFDVTSQKTSQAKMKIDMVLKPTLQITYCTNMSGNISSNGPEELYGMCNPDVGHLVPNCKQLLADEIFIEICS